jgi:bla regulator protein blaR1
MTLLDTLLSERWIEAIGWMVVHSIWQITLIGGIVALGLAWSRKATARWRYHFLQVCMVLTVAWAAYTFGNQLKPSAAFSEVEVVLVDDVGQVLMPRPAVAEVASTSPGLLTILKTWLSDHLTYLVWIWAVGVLIFALRFAGGWWYVHQLRHRGLAAAPQKWVKRLRHWATELGLDRPVRLLESSFIKTPMVLGWWRPVILVPTGLWTGLEPVQIEALLVHELSHIRRHDYLWNIVQSLVEALFYYHPLVWWMSDKLRQERELCCDDLVVQNQQHPAAYAKALLYLEQIKGTQPRLALAATGSGGQLLNRVQRILQSPNYKKSTMEKVTLSILVAAMGTLISISHPLERPKEARTEVDAKYTFASDQKFDYDVRFLSTDTLPKGRTEFDYNNNGESMRAVIEDGEIKQLNINGREIPASEFDKYESRVVEVLEQTPPPPPPPAPRAIASPPPPPAPPAPNVPPPPPPPPVPPYPDTIPKGLTEEQQAKMEKLMIEMQEKMEDRQKEMESKMREVEQLMAEKMEKEQVVMEEAMRKMELEMAEHEKELENNPERLREIQIKMNEKQKAMQKNMTAVLKDKQAEMQDLQRKMQKMQREMMQKMQAEQKELMRKLQEMRKSNKNEPK